MADIITDMDTEELLKTICGPDTGSTSKPMNEVYNKLVTEIVDKLSSVSFSRFSHSASHAQVKCTQLNWITHPIVRLHTSFYKNIVYKNTEAHIC